MNSHNELKTKKITACILGALMVVFMLLSTLFIVIEAEHDCTGEDCPICVCIQQCESTLQQISNGTASAITVILPILFAFLVTMLSADTIRQYTLVSQKIRLNN